MDDGSSPSRPLTVPSGRLNRLSRLGAMSAGIAGNMALQALGEMGRGQRPEMRSLLLTPRNLNRLAEELARMRGAAMKVGQLMSMDAGDILPPELAQILSRLRDNAHIMPPAQLKQVLNRNWGPDWLRSFKRFEVRPVAAASIGQVHRALLRDGRDVAIKVQYPGVARSIDSDVANVAGLVRLSGLLPKGFDLAPYVEEARRQLHEETDYDREATQLKRFATLLKDEPDFVLPEVQDDWSTGEILTMSFLEGLPIESAETAPQEERDLIAQALIKLTLREIFDFGLIQSDPNFANFRYDPQSGRIQLLDFGAARPLDQGLVKDYRSLLKAGLAGNREGLKESAIRIGFITGQGPFDDRITNMMEAVFAAIEAQDIFDFADRTLSDRLTREGTALAEAGFVPPLLPMDVLYLQRKVGGIFLLASRLRAQLPIRELIAPFIESAQTE